LEQIDKFWKIDAKNLLDQGFDPKLPSNRAIGAREIIDAINGKTSMEDAIEKSKILTHQYAKKQRTWFRSKMKNWAQIEMSPEFNAGQFIDTLLG
jgi:tRNA dimethylallyltransferase